MAKLTHCCHCISLRTGTLVIGILHLVVILGFMCGVIKVTIDRVSNEMYYTVARDPRYFLFFSLAVTQIWYNVRLIIAAKKGREEYASYWMVYNFLLLFISTYGIIIYIAIAAVLEEDILAFVIPILAYFLYIAVTIYELMVVYSFTEEDPWIPNETKTSDLLPPPWMVSYLNETKGKYILLKN